MSTVVFFHAHPDDEAIATGGTMALAKQRGHRVVLVLATRGECGEPVPGVLAEGEELWERRVIESHRSAAELGVDLVEFLGYRDSGMIGEPTNDDPSCFWQADVDEASARLADILRREHASVLTVYDDHGGYGHPDHIQVHRVGITAAALAGVQRVFESTMNRDHILKYMAAATEGQAERPDLDMETFGSAERDITHGIDVSSVIDRKRAAMAVHESQIAPDAFFFQMPNEVFTQMFGTEWYIDRSHARAEGAPYGGDLFV